MMNDFIRMIEQADTICILGHTKPDGDCVGSTLGMYNYIISNYQDKQVQVYLEEFNKDFMFLNGADLVCHELDDRKYQLCMVLDCGDTKRPGEFIKYYNEAEHTICVDHHVSNKGFGDYCNVDPDACAASEVIYKLIDSDKINKYTAECLYMGIVHDTGVFKHSNTTKSAMTIAGDLIEKGARPSFIIDYTFYKKTFSQNKLMARAIDSAKLYHNGMIIVGLLSEDDFKETGTFKGDTDGIIDQLRITEGIEAAVFIYQTGPDECKISMRSNDIVDVSSICVALGGGGHLRAAGVTIKNTLNEAAAIAVSMIEEQLP